MTAATPALPTSTPTHAGYLVGQVWPTARWLLRVAAFLGAWFWGVVIAGVTVVTVVVAVVGEPTVSVLSFARQGAIWFPMSTFIMVSTAYLPVHVAAGLTRRSLARGAVVTAAVVAVGNGAVFVLLLLLERGVYDAAGWQWRFVDDMSAGAPPSTFVPGSLLTFLTANLAGLLVGMAYQRGGALWGTLTLPLTAGPILVVSALFAADAGQIATGSGFVGRGMSTPTAVAASLLICAVMAFVFDRLARGAAVPVRTT